MDEASSPLFDGTQSFEGSRQVQGSDGYKPGDRWRSLERSAKDHGLGAVRAATERPR